MGTKVFTGLKVGGTKEGETEKEAGDSSQDMRDSSPALPGGNP